MKYASILLLLICCYSCDFFTAKKTTTEAVLKEELETFNWTEVDSYPTFDVCNAKASREEKKQCFEYTLTNTITKYLERQVIIVTTDVNDTLKLKLELSSKGELHLKALQMDTLTQKEIPNLKALVKESLQTLPKIYPALKRAQHVNTAFELPLIVKVQ